MKYHVEFTDADLTKFRVDSPCIGSHGNRVIVLKDINHGTRGFELKADEPDRSHGERATIDNYLSTLVRTSKTCEQCLLRRGNICFFAYNCFPNYSWFTNAKEGEK